MISQTVLQSKYAPAVPPPSSANGKIDRQALVENHLSKVKYIADRIAAKLPPSVEREDLYGAGVIGLMEAAERFDPARGIAFTTFAELRVRGAILDSLRELDWASRTTRRRSRELQAAYAEIEQQRGRPATEEEVAGHLGISIHELHNLLNDLRCLTISEQDEKEDEDGRNPLEAICDTGDSPFEQYEKTERREKLTQAIDKLPERERQVIALYYLEELTMKEIGLVMGVTESRVSQLRTQAIVRLRGNLQ